MPMKKEPEETKKEEVNKQAFSNLKDLTSGLYIKEDCVINIVEDYGFKYDSEKRCYYNKNKSLCVDKETRLIYALKSEIDLSIIAKMQELNILSIKKETL